MENSVFLVGKRIRGHHLIVTTGMLSPEQLDGMNRKGWVLSRMRQKQANFHYDFVREMHQPQIVGF
ncbi:hypothetical protein [Ammoniphilus sp. CFH 90114]|uniref:hypothetical protein n=1 Tax=Ammoniphilus sp. CFH 90114 TaxID=2493665 RepID=UPI00100F2811|nr:hypothetical protein [Ammoniphilus sp. CFH 90114]RXT08112.1 hypothetical protein EIZ39_11945 [Ammoniphilus sp. CFH 90114]